MWPVLVFGSAVLWLARVRRNPQLTFFEDVGFDDRWPELRASKQRRSGPIPEGRHAARLYHTGVYGFKATNEWLLKKLGHTGGKQSVALGMALNGCLMRIYRDQETGETLVPGEFSRFVEEERAELDDLRKRGKI